jgi:hypothetical protein
MKHFAQKEERKEKRKEKRERVTIESDECL